MDKPICFFLAVLYLFSATILSAAAPGVHILCAQIYFKNCRPNYTQAQRDEFIRGTLFPDIRYIARIPRSKTHQKNVTLDQVKKAPSPFKAGMLFHAYVDEQREIIAQDQKIYEHLSDIPAQKKGLFLKVVEDELCYHSLQDIPKLRHAFLVYDTEEGAYGISFLRRMAWHRILRGYLKKSPLTLLEQKIASKSGYFTISYESIAQALPLLKKYKEDAQVKRYVAHFLENFEKLLQKEGIGIKN